ncbi:MAG: prepilin-type N-terminal cleavage/methylation domain-containing protein [Desulfuromonas sp.]|nr:prepilin-type N-terminal cleavage/methylation domain-containing protein [Desulfuromonas sp.]
MSQQHNNENGFTLIEVMIALTIFAIGLLGVAGMQVTALKGNSTAHSVSAKVALGSGIIEEFLALEGNDPRLTTEVTDDPWAFATEEVDPPTDPPTFTDVEEINIAGAGNCSATVTVNADPVIGTTTYTGLTQIVVTTHNPKGRDVEQTIMKRRY